MLVMKMVYVMPYMHRTLIFWASIMIHWAIKFTQLFWTTGYLAAELVK